MIVFAVYGDPVAQGRPRATTVNGRVRMYDPPKSRNYKEYLRFLAAEHAPDKLLEGPLAMDLRVYRRIPKSFSKKKKAAAIAGELRPVTKPDADNYLKSVKDALNGVIWRDDSQVVNVSVGKWYGEKPRVEIRISGIEEVNKHES
ncbi:RusA family crossover junction endodeoxyribonuclease [Numidum massiliense]|uniref:RusA family crossover junction endodeoxyribonuclease n=1 Tax=Numidum massiliense TaxID=1522315 RepID=UPI0006D54C40|nr:RusA family crossover junction endodeoxyribonuclease [Numidum massiliense]